MKLLTILCQVIRIVLVRGIMHNGNMFLLLETLVLIGVRTLVMCLSSPCGFWKAVVYSSLSTEYPSSGAYLCFK